MKNFFSLFFTLLMLFCTAGVLAEEIAIHENIPDFDIKITIPDHAQVVQEDLEDGFSLSIHLDPKEGTRPEYRLTIAPSEEVYGRCMADFTEEEKQQLAAAWSENMTEPTYVYETLENGKLMLLLEENTETSDFAYMITAENGYFINLYMSYNDYDKLSDADLETMFELMQSIQIIPTA